MLKEFKEFAMKGNVMDMAIGVIIGGAFGKIVTSLVNDIIMPPIGVMMGGVDFSKLAFIIKAATNNNPAVTINYGVFINVVINFLIIAFVIFIIVKQLNNLKKEEKKEEKEEKPPKEVQLLEEIRDALKNQ